MSFMLTTEQVRARTKTVTRRLGWQNLKPDALLRAVVKAQGLRKGEKHEVLATIRVEEVRRERLDRLTQLPPMVAAQELRREGFPDMTPADFVQMFCVANRCLPGDEVTRIVFDYVEAP